MRGWTGEDKPGVAETGKRKRRKIVGRNREYTGAAMLFFTFNLTLKHAP